MNIFTKARILATIAVWRYYWYRHDTRRAYTVPGNPKFMGPRDAAKHIQDGAVIALSGLAGNTWATIVYQAIREMFQETGHPRDLTLLCIGALGARGRAPGSAEEFGIEGLCTRLFTGHTETYKSLLRLADAGKLELQCLPQGTFALLLDAQGRGEDAIINDTGIGTFLDPRTGRGTPVVGDYPQYVSVVDGRMRYTCPKVDVAIFNVPAADRKGNLYMRGAAMIAESQEIARAARRNGGYVIANVGLLVDEGYDEVFLSADEVDAIVLYHRTEQVGGVPHKNKWKIFSLGSDYPIEKGVEQLRFVNGLLGYTPIRTPADNVLARLAATIFSEQAGKGCYVDIGVGLPEEASRLFHESGLIEDINIMTESGVFGGLPAPGIHFGAAVNPEEIVSSAEAFRRIYDHLDAVILGALEVDSDGNVNVSKRGEGAINYVGPGGFIDLTACAKLVMFCTAWGDGADVRVEGNRVRVVKRGKPKFIDRVAEVTFSGEAALNAGKRAFYITHVGAFQHTERGMELIRVMPGIDVQRDILDATPMKIVLPENGQVPVVDDAVVTGKDFRLSFK